MKYMEWKEYEDLNDVIDHMESDYYYPAKVLFYNLYVFFYNNTYQKCKKKD